MRIEKIEFNNFRKYVNTSINFDRNENDIHVIIADNGAGKTTFLNAITWCLYNEEPKIKDDKESLPTLNTEVSNNSQNDHEIASVSISVVGDDIKLIFKRSDIFKIHSFHSDYYKYNNKREEWVKQEFIVTEFNNDNKPNVITDYDECIRYVSSFIPESIKEFFFFDGEQLDDYFLSSSAIQEQVFKLSNIFLLESMERRIEDRLKNLKMKKAPNKSAQEKLEEYNGIIANIKSEQKRYASLKKSYDSLDSELSDLMNNLGNVKSIKSLEDKRDNIIKRQEKLNGFIKNKKESIMDLIIKESPKIFARNAFIKSLELIKNSKEDKTFIYPIDETILSDSISEGSCKLCDRKLDEDLKLLLEDKKAKLYLIPPEDKILNSNSHIFKRSLKVVDNYNNVEERLHEEIKNYQETIDDLEEDIQELYESISVNKHLEKSIERRDELVRLLPSKKSDLDAIDRNIKLLEKNSEILDNEYDNLCAKEEQYSKVLAKKKLCQNSLNVIAKVKKDMMDETRKIIEDKTKKYFFNLIRKSATYGDISITDNYEVKLYDFDGRPARFSASASEVELLSLAFTLAIHSVSGFESSLVMDTILARTTGEQKLNVAKGCLNISKHKQILLFLMDDEYSIPVKELFMDNYVSEYSLVETESEKEIIIRRR